MKKKTLSRVLAFSLCAALLATTGCGGSDKKDGSTDAKQYQQTRQHLTHRSATPTL